MKCKWLQQGFTLLELVISIVILGIGAASFMVLINQTTRDSVDPLIRQQATAIAQSYLEEILLHSYCDPDLDCDSVCTAPCATNCSNPEGSNRPVYDDIFDYRNLPDNTVRARNNAAISGLDNYAVKVGIQDSGASLGGLSGNSCEVARINIQVNHSALASPIVLSGYKVNY